MSLLLEVDLPIEHLMSLQVELVEELEKFLMPIELVELPLQYRLQLLLVSLKVLVGMIG
jgi:hypothetical protein